MSRTALNPAVTILPSADCTSFCGSAVEQQQRDEKQQQRTAVNQ